MPLADLDDIFKKRVDRLNPGGGMRTAPRDARWDWLDNTLRRAQEIADARRKAEEEARKRQEEEQKRAEAERKRQEEERRKALAAMRQRESEFARQQKIEQQQRVARDASGEGNVAFSGRDLNRIRREQDSAQRSQFMQAFERDTIGQMTPQQRGQQALREAGIPESEWVNYDINKAAEKYTEQYRSFAADMYASGQKALKSHGDAIRDKSGFGRGVAESMGYDKFAQEDPIRALAMNPNFSVFPDEFVNWNGRNTKKFAGIPEDIKRYVAMYRGLGGIYSMSDEERREKWPELMQREFDQMERMRVNQYGPITGAVKGGLDKLPGGEAISPLIAFGLVQPTETVGAGGLSVLSGIPALGEKATGIDLGFTDQTRKFQRSVGIDDRLSNREKTAFTIENAAGFAATWGPAAKGGSPMSLFAKNAVANLALDVPATSASLWLRGVDPVKQKDEWAKVMAITAGGDLIGAALPTIIPKPVKWAVGKSKLPPEVLAGITTYAVIRGTGADNEEAQLGAWMVGGAVRSRRLLEGLTGSRYTSVPGNAMVDAPVLTRAEVQQVNGGIRTADGRTIAGTIVDSPKDLPPTLYHVTAATRAIKQDGNLRPQTGQNTGGLGQDTSKAPAVYLTKDAVEADNIAFEMRRVIQIARGELTIDDLPRLVAEDEARAGLPKGALRPLLEQAMEFYRFQSADLASVNAARRQMGIPELNAHPNADPRRAFKEAYEGYLENRPYEGALPDPILMGDIDTYARLDPADVGILPIKRENLFKSGALVVTNTADVLDEVVVHGPIPIKGITAKAPRSLAASLGREAAVVAAGGAVGFGITGDKEGAAKGAAIASSFAGNTGLLGLLRKVNPTLAKRITADDAKWRRPTGQADIAGSMGQGRIAQDIRFATLGDPPNTARLDPQDAQYVRESGMEFREPFRGVDEAAATRELQGEILADAQAQRQRILSGEGVLPEIREARNAFTPDDPSGNPRGIDSPRTVREALEELAYGPSDGLDADFARLERQREKVIKRNNAESNQFARPERVPVGDPRLRAREILDGSWGPDELGLDINVKMVNGLAETEQVLDSLLRRHTDLDGNAIRDRRVEVERNRIAKDEPAVVDPRKALFEEENIPSEKKVTRGQAEPESPPAGATQMVNDSNATIPPKGEGSDAPPAEPKKPADNLPEPRNPEVKTKMDQYVAEATEQQASNRVLSRALPGIGKLLDPGVRFDTPKKRRVLTGIIAGANLERFGHSDAMFAMRNRLRAANDLIGEGATTHLKRAAVELAGPAAVAAIAYANDEDFGGAIDEMLFLAGGLWLGTSSAAMSRGFMREKRWMKYKMLPEFAKDEKLPAALREGSKEFNADLKFMDMLERPQAYGLEGHPGLKALTELRDATLERTNEFRQVAGIPDIDRKAKNAIMHSYSRESFEKTFPGESSHMHRAIRVESTSMSQRLPIERQRELGETWYDVLRDYPDLRPAGNVRELLAEELRIHAKLRGNAVMTYHLKSDPETARYVDPKDDVLRQKLLRGGWGMIAGVDDYMFHPEVIQAVEGIMLPVGKHHPLMDFADNLTNNVRTSLFVGDFSAWTMQGAMLAVNNFPLVVRNFHDLVGASLSPRYYEWWLSRRGGKNAAKLESAIRAGVIPGFEFEGRERAGNIIAQIPAIKKLEDRGFQSMLPMMRTLMHDNLRQQNALIETVGKAHNIPLVPEAANLLIEAGKLVPAAATGIAVDKLGSEDGERSALDNALTIFATVLVAGLSDHAVARGGDAAFNRLSPERQVRANVRAGKQVNRTGGTLNRQQLGMSNVQSQIERVWMMRSPALTRNVVNLARLALTNSGPEGAAARMYVLKTVAMYTVLAAGMKYAVTGEMDSFDYQDPNSVLNPESAFRSRLGESGTITPSHPFLSLLRAVVYQDRPDGQATYDWSRWADPKQLLHDKATGAGGFIAGRLPDVTGIGTRPITESVFGRSLKDKGESDSAGAFEKLATDPAGTALTGLTRVLPVAAQSAIESGVIEKSALVPDNFSEMTGVKNDGFTTSKEKLLGALVPFLGANFSPESLGSESYRIQTEVMRDLMDKGELSQFGQVTDRTDDGVVDYNDLNDLQRKAVRTALEGNTRAGEVQSALDARGETVKDPIGQLFDARDGVNKWYDREMTRLQIRVNTGKMSKMEFRKEYQDLGKERRNRMDQVENDLANVPVGKAGVDMTVGEWLKRNEAPEDKAFDRYQRLYDKAMVDGKVDYDLLERLQSAYLKSLPGSRREYVQARLDDIDKPSKFRAINEYRAIQKDLKPYWELKERVFTTARQQSGFFAEFENAKEFEGAVAKMAMDYKLSNDDMMAYLEKTVPEVRQYNNSVSQYEKWARLNSPEIDNALTEWYGYTPADRIRFIAMEFGYDAPPIEYSQSLFTDNQRNRLTNVIPVANEIYKRGPVVDTEVRDFRSLLWRNK